MKKRIYFNIDEISRDAVVAANLKIALEKFNIKLEYGSRARSTIFKHTCPFDAVIFHSVGHLEAFFKKLENLNVPAILLPAEGVGAACRDTHRFTETLVGRSYAEGTNQEWARKISAYCLWGQQQLENIQEAATEFVERCYIIGHPRHDSRCLSGPKVNNVDNQKIRVGLITRFDSVNPWNDQSALEGFYLKRQSQNYYGFSKGDEHLDAENLYFTNIADVRVMLDLIDRLNSEQHEILLRVHPRENRMKWVELIKRWNLPVALAAWDQPFSHFLQEVDYSVGPPSTTAYDCYVAGKTSISTGNIVSKQKEHIAINSDDNGKILDFVLEPNSIDELIKIISEKPPASITLPDKVKQILTEEGNYPDCLNSIDRLAEVCNSVIKKNKARKAPSVWQYIKYKLWAFRKDMLPRRGGEQGSSYRLTRRRIRWINNLAN